jgi:hypothetical protein
LKWNGNIVFVLCSWHIGYCCKISMLQFLITETFSLTDYRFHSNENNDQYIYCLKANVCNLLSGSEKSWLDGFVISGWCILAYILLYFKLQVLWIASEWGRNWCVCVLGGGLGLDVEAKRLGNITLGDIWGQTCVALLRLSH